MGPSFPGFTQKMRRFKKITMVVFWSYMTVSELRVTWQRSRIELRGSARQKSAGQALEKETQWTT
jgi:hypothetical protein